MNPLAQALVNAVKSRTALDPANSGLTPASAYEVQDEVIAELGGEVEAAKLGLTSRAKQTDECRRALRTVGCSRGRSSVGGNRWSPLISSSHERNPRLRF